MTKHESTQVRKRAAFTEIVSTLGTLHRQAAQGRAKFAKKFQVIQNAKTFNLDAWRPWRDIGGLAVKFSQPTFLTTMNVEPNRTTFPAVC